MDGSEQESAKQCKNASFAVYASSDDLMITDGIGDTQLYDDGSYKPLGKLFSNLKAFYEITEISSEVSSKYSN